MGLVYGSVRHQYYAHGADIKSVRFYFNPVNAKFELIPFDGHRIVVDLNKNIIGWENFRNCTII